MPVDLQREHGSGLAMFDASVKAVGDTPFLLSDDAVLTFAEADRDARALAAAFRSMGVRRGDRVALYLQNVPEFAVSLIAAWRVGAVVVPVNPMLKERELRSVLADSGACVVVAMDSLVPTVRAAADADAGLAVSAVVSTSSAPPDGAMAFADLVARGRGEGGDGVVDVRLAADDVALLTYTSGTTGPPKGAMNTHGNVAFNAQVYRDWIGLTRSDTVLAVAPLFHITGMIGHLATAMLVGIPVVLGGRFAPAPFAELVERHRPTFTVGSITAFIALLNDADARRRDLSSLTKVYSGGAPIAPAVVEAFEDHFGAYIHNIYGLTETTSPSHAVPLGMRAPVDPTSGALSIGVPVCSTDARVVRPDGSDADAGEVGEIVIRGPQVVAGYWHKPEETAAALRDGWLFTGDVGFMDADGWFYVVDRKKDQINAAGYKVWPREVEDVLYQHPAVREAAVVGVPDAYRGETVKAFVSLRPGASTGSDELIAFCRDRMAAYKYPRLVEVLDDLPKTATGKILRRSLREGE